MKFTTNLRSEQNQSEDQMWVQVNMSLANARLLEQQITENADLGAMPMLDEFLQGLSGCIKSGR